ncbi:hypothetical protein TKK_0017666 [Trichogramma kaykai]
MRKSIILVATIISCASESSALSGYMCGRNSPNFTSVMTSTIGGCDVPIKNPESQEVYLQLLQHLAYRKDNSSAAECWCTASSDIAVPSHTIRS